MFPKFFPIYFIFYTMSFLSFALLVFTVSSLFMYHFQMSFGDGDDVIIFIQCFCDGIYQGVILKCEARVIFNHREKCFI